MNDIDYKVLKIIYKNGGKAKIKHIQQNLKNYGYDNVRYSTIDSCVERLHEQNLLIWEKYKPIKLTSEGEDFAKETIRHTQLLEVLLYKELDLTTKQAHYESEKFNLPLSCNTINKICEKYNHPEECPCGERILNSEACYCQKHFLK